MSFGVKFIPLKPAAHLRDVTNASAPFSSEQVNKAIQYVDTFMNDFTLISMLASAYSSHGKWNEADVLKKQLGAEHPDLLTSSQNCGDNDSLPAQDPMPQINDDEMQVDSDLEPPEEYDVFPDLAFLESISPHLSEFTEIDIGLDRMAELRALLLETFPDGMPKEIDYESILADQRVPSDPLDPSFWHYFEGSVQTEYTPGEQ